MGQRQGLHLPRLREAASWSDAHHVKHWIDGGATALFNLTLLCATTLPLAPLGGTPTWVHRYDLTADVTATDVTWQT